MNKHENWCVLIYLMGEQEINHGEGGVVEWFSAIKNKFSNWAIFPKFNNFNAGV